MMSTLVNSQHLRAAADLRDLLATFENNKDLIMLGAYKRGSDPRVDRSIAMIEEVRAFLRQASDEKAPAKDTISRLIAMFP